MSVIGIKNSLSASSVSVYHTVYIYLLIHLIIMSTPVFSSDDHQPYWTFCHSNCSQKFIAWSGRTQKVWLLEKNNAFYILKNSSIIHAHTTKHIGNIIQLLANNLMKDKLNAFQYVEKACHYFWAWTFHAKFYESI